MKHKFLSKIYYFSNLRNLRFSTFVSKTLLVLFLIFHINAWSVKEEKKAQDKTEAHGSTDVQEDECQFTDLPFFTVLKIISQLEYEDQKKMIFLLSKKVKGFFREHIKNYDHRRELLKSFNKYFHPKISAGYSNNVGVDKEGILNYWGKSLLGTWITGKTKLKPTEETFFHAVAASSEHGLALDNQGRVFSFGNNSDGQLGLGDTDFRNAPTQVLFPDRNAHIISIATSGHQSFAVDSEGRVHAWGLNSNGELGLGDTANRNTPTQVSFFSDRNIFITSIATSGHQSFAVDSEGRVYAWGFISNGELGLGDTADRNTPTQVSFFSDRNIFITHIALGGSHSLALDRDGRVYSWGSNKWGQLGLWDPPNRNWDTADRNTPTQVSFFSDRNIFITHIATGGGHNLALDRDGRVYSWGRNYCGELGLSTGEARPNVPKHPYIGCPRQIPFRSNNQIVSIAAGSSHSFAIDNLGRIYAWGLNSFRQLGLDNSKDREAPTLMQVFNLSPMITWNDLRTGLLPGEPLYDFELQDEINRLRRRNIPFSQYLNDNNIFHWVYGESNGPVDRAERMRLLRERIAALNSSNGPIILYIMGYGHIISLVIHNNIAYILEGLEANSQLAQDVLGELQSQQQALNLNSVNLINTEFQTNRYANLCGVIAIHGSLGLLEALNNNQQIGLDGLRDSVRVHLFKSVEPFLSISETTHTSQSSLMTPHAYSYVVPPLVAFILYLIFNYY